MKTEWRPKKGTLLKAVQYIFGVGAIFWVVSSADWRQIIRTSSNLSLSTLFLVFLASLVGVAFRAFTWYPMFSNFGFSGYKECVMTDLVINFINSLFPSRISGRSVAPMVVRHYANTSWSESVAITGVHTGIYAILYGAVSVIGLLAGYRTFSSGILLLLALSTALYIGAGIFILFGGLRLNLIARLLERTSQYISRVPYIGDKIADKAEGSVPFANDSVDAFRQLLNTRVIVLYSIGWITSLGIFPGIRVWLLMTGLGGSFDPLVLLPIYLITAYSVTLLPLTPGGIGVAEATASIVFVALGVPKEVIVPTILLDRFLGVYIPAIMGWYPLITANIQFTDTGGEEQNNSE